MELPVKNIFDLQSEIIRLEKSKQEQEMALKERFSSTGAIFATLKSMLPKSEPGAGKTFISNIFSPDLLNLLSRLVLPVALNKTLFKKSNFIVKTLVGFLSQKASTYISEDSVTTTWGRIKSLLGKHPKTAAKPTKV